MSRVSRRSFIEKAGVTLAVGSLSQASSAKGGVPSGQGAARGPGGKSVVRYGVERCVVEWAYSSGKAYADPFNDLELDVVFTDPQGREQRVPAFWAGEQVWRVRYSPATRGPIHLSHDLQRPRQCGPARADRCVGSLSLCRETIRCGNTVRCEWRRTAGTSSTQMARPSSGWATPGGWGCAAGCVGRKTFRSWRPTG